MRFDELDCWVLKILAAIEVVVVIIAAIAIWLNV